VAQLSSSLISNLNNVNIYFRRHISNKELETQQLYLRFWPVSVTSLTSECNDRNVLRSWNFSRFWRVASSPDRFICQRLHPVMCRRSCRCMKVIPLMSVLLEWKPKCCKHSDKETVLLHTPQRGVRFNFRNVYWGRDSDWLRAGRSRGRSSSPGRVKNFLYSMSSRLALGSTQPPIQWGPGVLSPGVKRPGREADHSPAASAEVKMWIYTSIPPYAFMA
jgi:hypothetical protein